RSGAGLEDGRNRRLQRRRPFRHPVAERQRASGDLGNERNQHHRRRRAQRQSRTELEGDRAYLTRNALPASRRPAGVLAALCPNAAWAAAARATPPIHVFGQTTRPEYPPAPLAP